MKRIIRLCLPALLAVLVFPGCLRDRIDPSGKDGNEILIQLKMPELTKTRSTAIGTAETDYAIGHLDVLVFEDKGGPGDVFMYAAEDVTERVHPDNPTTRTFALNLRLSENGERQKLVLVANLEDEVRDLLSTWVPDPSSMSMTKEDLFEKLFFSHDDWMTRYGGIPMWGESSGSVLVIRTTTGNSFGMINMLYSVAKVEVAVGANPSYTEARGVSEFKLAYSGLYNSRTIGYAAPQAASNYSGGKVHFPSIPQHCTVNPAVLERSVTRSDAGFPMLYVSPYNIPEADNKNSGNGDCVFLIVGGYYTEPGQPENTDKITYYRIDLYDRLSDEPTSNRLDVLRGHRYMVNITSVDGPGSDTPEEAVSSVPVIMNTEVIVWNISGSNVDFDGTQYYLNVSENAMTIGKDARTNLRLSVKTDVPSGYNIEVTDSAEKEGNPLGWIRLLSDVGGALTFEVDENLTAGPRVAYIHVTAGRLSNVVRVTQLNVQLLTLDVNVEPEYEMVFANHRASMSPIPAPAQTLSIEWDPAHLPINITRVTTLDGGVSFINPAEGTYNGGSADIEIQLNSMPDSDVANDVFREKVSRLDIELEGEDGARVMKSVFVRQKSYGVKMIKNPKRYNSMIAGATGTVTIAVNSPWQTEITGSAVASVSPSSGGANTSGQTLTFTMNQGSANSTAVVNSKIIIKSSLGVFPDYEIDINAVWGWVYDTQSGASYHDATGIYVAREYDGNGDFGPQNSPLRYYSISCPSGWKLPAINGIRSIWDNWGYSPQVRQQANFTEGGEYWCSTGGDAFKNHTLKFDGSRTEGQDWSTALSSDTHPYRCVRLITTDYASNDQ